MCAAFTAAWMWWYLQRRRRARLRLSAPPFSLAMRRPESDLHTTSDGPAGAQLRHLAERVVGEVRVALRVAESGSGDQDDQTSMASGRAGQRTICETYSAERGLCGGNPGDRHAVRRAADVVEPGELEEADRVGIAAVLAADAQLEIGAGLAPDPRRQPHEPADAGLVDRLERAAVEHLALHVAREEAALDVVAREPERGLGEVVGAEREEVGVRCDPVGHEAGPRQLDHRAQSRSIPSPSSSATIRSTSSRISSSSFS